MKKSIIFDFGGVLIDWDPSRVYRQYFATEQEISRFYQETGIYELNKEMDRGLPFAEALADLAEKFPHHAEPIWYWRDRWIQMIAGPISASVMILESMHRQGYDLYGLTNWSHETFPLVYEQYAFFQLFKDIVVSGREKLIKPEPAIFQLLLNRNQLEAKNCLFIDDNQANVEAAIALNIDAIQFISAAELQQQLIKRGIRC
jgi:2-haloacid dehalogenase